MKLIFILEGSKKKMKKSNKKEKEDEWEDCDDCPICQVMKNGEANNMEGMMKAFEEAQRQGKGKVGFGDIKPNDNSIPSPYQKR